MSTEQTQSGKNEGESRAESMTESITKSRLRWAGKPSTTEEIERNVLNYALQGKGASEIAKLGMKSREQVSRYLKELKDSGKLKVTDTGRLESQVAFSQSKAAQWTRLSKDEFISGFDSVKSWADRMTGRISGASDLARRVQVICDTLKITPDAILATARISVTGKDSLESLMDTFGKEYRKDHKINDAGFVPYARAIVSFVTYNGVAIPDRLGGSLSREKMNYGQYSSVKLTDTERDSVIRYALGHFKHGIALAIAVGHEAVSPRSFTLRIIRTEQVRFVRRWGHMTAEFDVFEPKTRETFPKIVIDPRIVNLLQLASKMKQKYLFGNGKELDETQLAEALRESYSHVGKDVTSEGTGGLINYWKVKPIHAMRHSTTDLWLRRLGLNASLVKILGWKTEEMITGVYAKMSKDYLFSQGRCDECRPEAHSADESNNFFCSLKCAVAYMNTKSLPPLF